MSVRPRSRESMWLSNRAQTMGGIHPIRPAITDPKQEICAAYPSDASVCYTALIRPWHAFHIPYHTARLFC